MVPLPSGGFEVSGKISREVFCDSSFDSVFVFSTDLPSAIVERKSPFSPSSRSMSPALPCDSDKISTSHSFPSRMVPLPSGEHKMSRKVFCDSSFNSVCVFSTDLPSAMGERRSAFSPSSSPESCCT